MGRIMQPRELAELKGAHKHDPQRYRNTPPKNPHGIGQPPDHLGEMAKSVWFELETFALPGVLTASDRFIMEITANLLTEYRVDPAEFSVGKHSILDKKLQRLGLDPASRQKLVTADKPKDNEFDVF